MKIEIVTGASTYESAINTIRQIDTKNFDFQNIVVVPDAFSMQAEKLVFDILKIKSTFNVMVVGISKLASYILTQNNTDFKRISALEEIFNIFSAVKSCEEKFLYFKKCDIEFCTKILQIIKQFKACGIASERLELGQDTLLSKKMHDIKIVYEEYDKLLGDKLDLSALLEKASFDAQNGTDLSKLNLYFANFDSFTMEIGQFICKLASKVNKVCVGMAKPISISNEFIFEDDIMQKISKFAGENNVLVDNISFKTNLAKNQLQMAKNLFGFQLEKGESDFFLNVTTKNADEEVEFVAKYIKKQIYNGKEFNDFAVAISDEKYYEIIKEIFEKYDITYYCDDAVNLSQTILGRFIFKCLEIAKLGFDSAKLEYIVQNPLFDWGNRDEILSDIFRFQIDNEKDFLQKYPQFQNVILTIKNLKNLNTVEDFALKLCNLLEICYEKYAKTVDEIEKNNLYKKSSENKQSYQLILNVFEKLKNLAGKQTFDIFDFENLLMFAFSSVKVETIPSYINAVYVGDATESYFEDVENLFVLGANSGSLPKSRNDTGIIDDEDIKNLKVKFLLEPEIKVLNRRNRLKLFECLLHAKSKLFVCTPMFEGGKSAQEASFVNDLKTIFGNKTLNYSAMSEFDNIVFDGSDKFQNLLLHLGSMKNFQKEYSALLSKKKVPIQFMGLLKKVSSQIRVDEKYDNIDLSVRKKFAKQTISASELENYFTCPFKRFVNYDLKVKERESVKQDKSKFGSFQHELLEKFVLKNNFQIKDADIDKFIEDNLLEIAKNYYDQNTLCKQYFVKHLKKESRIILKNAVYEQTHSKFRPKYVEFKISNEFTDKRKLVGFVDRIDVLGDEIRVVDYKTGKQEAIKKSLYYGKKLQLFLYADAVTKKLGKRCVGVYYFDCQTKYSSGNKTQTKLIGLTKKENDVVEAMDTRVGIDGFRSDLIGMKAKKDVKEGEFAYSYGIPAEDFSIFFDYAVDISKQALDEIDDGYIKPSPVDDSCRYCPYNSICKHRKEDGQRKTTKVESDDVFKRKNGI